MKLNIPIILTLLRIALIPIFVLLFYLPFHASNMWAAIIFVIASITDWFDGYLARKWRQTTRFGAFLDPVADKILVTIALLLITEYWHTWWITLPAIIMIAREILISALREWMSEIGKRSSVSVSIIGKIKTATQMIALILLIWRPTQEIIYIGYLSLYIAVFLTLWSMYIYLKAASNDLLNEEV